MGNAKMLSHLRVQEITVNYEVSTAHVRLLWEHTCAAYVDFHGGASQYVGLGRECVDYRFVCRTYVSSVGDGFAM